MQKNAVRRPGTRMNAELASANCGTWANQRTNISRPTEGDLNTRHDPPLQPPRPRFSKQRRSYFFQSNEEILFSCCQRDSHINDPKLSDRGAWRGSCEGGAQKEATDVGQSHDRTRRVQARTAATVTRGAVRCSAWLGVAVISEFGDDMLLEIFGVCRRIVAKAGVPSNAVMLESTA